MDREYNLGRYLRSRLQFDPKMCQHGRFFLLAAEIITVEKITWVKSADH